ncbi:MAG: DUF6020 family protein [Bacillus sp. (in: Bacteria)]|nr:DUF6020 family protein [Bacillus sp. (in: firmicutes)]MCM1425441.1 DUF6020 family protein [Eubacterium sp.]
MKENEFKIRFTLNFIAFFIATAGTLCIPQILNLKANTLGFTNSIFSVFVWLLSLYAMDLSLHTIDLRDMRGWKIAGVLSFLFTAAMLFGVRLEAEENVDFKDWKLWVSLPVLTCFFTILVRKSWNFLGNMEERKERLAAYIKIPSPPAAAVRHANILTFFFLLLCWLPVLLAVYPGFFVYDAQEEYIQVASRVFTTHHPLTHVLLLGGIICAVHKITDSYNLGIACYMIVQMVIVAGGFTCLLSYFRKKKVSRAIHFLSLLYFAFFPVIVMFTLCSAKDTIFTVALLLLLVNVLEMGISPDDFFASKTSMAFFILTALMMLLFRKNGIYAFVLMIPVFLLYHKKNRKKMGVLLCGVLAAYCLINETLTFALHAQDTENQEILTVPIQQLARTYKFNKEVFSPDETAALHEVLSEEALSLYNPKLSDPVKYHFQNAAYAADKSKYLSLWVKIGLKKPLSYINAWLMNSYGFWYPDTIINVYAGNTVFTFTYQDSSYFGYEVEQPGVRDSKIPWLDEAYRRLSLEIEQEKIPILSMLYSPGGMFWCFAYVFSYVFYRKKYHILIPYLLVLLIWLTVLLGPTYLPRYVLIFWFGLPLFAAVMLEEEKFGQVVK